MVQFSVNPQRFDPYKSFKFRIKWNGKYVAGVSKIGALRRTTEMAEHREGGRSSSVRKSPSKSNYGAITLERGITQDTEFENWASKGLTFGSGLDSEVSLKDFRKNIIIEVYTETGQLAMAYKVFRCWVSEYQALPGLEASTNVIAIQTLKLENEGWERDDASPEPTEGLGQELQARAGSAAPNIPGAERIPAKATWEDLILPEQSLSKLREFVQLTENRQELKQWGRRFTYGPVALFSGPSGTGKTFAAEVVANVLDFPLFRVDLGLMVSKYIGETEKNLNQLFDASQGENIVLLFDKADALFGKRGDVKIASDRYANMAVSHLLSRIEQHQGPCILTSNLRQHIDLVFLRRIQVLVDFPPPDASARAEIWRCHLPAEASLDEGVDFIQLGREFNLNGAQISNASRHAALLATGCSTAISPAHITSAVWTELVRKKGE